MTSIDVAKRETGIFDCISICIARELKFSGVGLAAFEVFRLTDTGDSRMLPHRSAVLSSGHYALRVILWRRPLIEKPV